MTLAVLTGSERGVVLRTTRARISIGSDESNDLVLREPTIEGQHFSIVSDEASWRIQTLSEKQQVVIDPRWMHPDTKKRGALIYAGGIELLFFPGPLDDATVAQEIRRRMAADLAVPAIITGNEVARVGERPRRFGRDMRDLGLEVDANLDVDGTAMTIPLPKVRHEELASMATLSSGAIPDSIRRQAQAGMRDVSGGDGDLTIAVSQEALAAEIALRKRALVRPQTSLGTRRISPNDTVIDARPRASESRVSEWTPESTAPDHVVVQPPAPRSPRKSAPPTPIDRTSWQPREGSDAPTNAQVVAVRDSIPVARPSRPSGNTASAWDNSVGGRARGSVPPNEPSVSARPSQGPKALPAPKALALFEIHTKLADLRRRDDVALEVWRNPDGPFATAIRLFATRLLELSRTYGYRTYMITSAEPLTGKTTVASNLALALAEDPKRRVALLEANFRTPRIGDIFGAPDRMGLLAALEGRAQVTQSAVKVAERSLVVFPAGGRHAYPNEVLASPRLRTLVGELTETVDIAIVDATHVRNLADTNLILPMVDGALLVALDHSTHGVWIAEAVEQLGKERVLGALYNQANRPLRRRLKEERKRRRRQPAG